MVLILHPTNGDGRWGARRWDDDVTATVPGSSHNDHPAQDSLFHQLIQLGELACGGLIAAERDVDDTNMETFMIVQHPRQRAADIAVADASSAGVTGLDEYQLRIPGDTAIETV